MTSTSPSGIITPTGDSILRATTKGNLRTNVLNADYKNPEKFITQGEHFFTLINSISNRSGNLGLFTQTSGTGNTTSQITTPAGNITNIKGIQQLSTGTATATINVLRSEANIYLNNTVEMRCSFEFALPTIWTSTAQGFRIFLGLVNPTITGITDGIAFEYLPTANTLIPSCRNGGTISYGAGFPSISLVANTLYRVTILIKPNIVEFFTNDTYLTGITTNIPYNKQLMLVAMIRNEIGTTSKLLWLDYMDIQVGTEITT